MKNWTEEDWQAWEEEEENRFRKAMRAKRDFIETAHKVYQKSKVLSVKGRDWDVISLTKSTYPGVKYQVTRWDWNETGDSLVPLGHIDITTSLLKAIEEVWHFAQKDPVTFLDFLYRLD